MKNTIRTELASHIIDLIDDGVLTNNNMEDWHFHAFNRDHYIIGYYSAEQWLKSHEISAFQAISEVIEWELELFGEINIKPININAETIVNMLAYIYGEQLLYEKECDNVEQLKQAMEAVL